jgi:hypothetical protein
MQIHFREGQLKKTIPRVATTVFVLATIKPAMLVAASVRQALSSSRARRQGAGGKDLREGDMKRKAYPSGSGGPITGLSPRNLCRCEAGSRPPHGGI